MYYLKSDFSQVYQKDGVFFRKSKTCSEKTIIPDEIKEHDIIKFVWYKIKHKLDKNFIRIVTVIVSNEIKRALFQYIGNQPMKCKKIRVDPVSIQKVKDDINVKSKKIKNTIDDPIVSTKTIKNTKYRVNNKHKEFKEKNIANDLENCFKKVGDGFVQYLKKFNNPVFDSVHHNLSSFVLFTEDQFLDMLTCSKDLGSVLSIDRTFNLGAHFLTAITFKNSKVTFRNNYSNPVFLGPCFLHKKSKQEDYDHFFNLIKSKIDSLFPEFDYSKLSFVTDGEHALINSVYKIFPESLMFRCHLHITKNITYHLNKSNFNFPQQAQKNRQFNSLILSEDLFSFSETKMDILSTSMDKKTEDNLQKLIEEIFIFVKQPMWEKKLLSPLTTNQSESMNHVIKNHVSWNKTNTAELINNLKSIVKFHYDNLNFAIFDQGDYRINNSFSYHQYQAFSEQVKNKHYKDLINNSFRYIVSDTGKTKIPANLQGTAKKPGSRKRIRATRTFSKP